jgi:membrane-associated protein
MLSDLLNFLVHIDRYLEALIGQYGLWVYMILFLVIFVETGLVVTPFLPGDSLLFITGALAARGLLSVEMLCLLLTVAAITGDSLNYWIGKSCGMNLLYEKYPTLFKKNYCDLTCRFYEKYGGATIVVARFVPYLRTFAPFLAGVGTMEYRRFLAYNASGGIAWILVFVLGGYFFGNIPLVAEHFDLVMYAVAGITLVAILSMVSGVIHYFRQKGSC